MQINSKQTKKESAEKSNAIKLNPPNKLVQHLWKLNIIYIHMYIVCF